jgi:hypothetical protein
MIKLIKDLKLNVSINVTNEYLHDILFIFEHIIAKRGIYF